MKTKSVKISDRTKEHYEKRDRTLDNGSEAPTLPFDMWARGSVGKYYRLKDVGGR